MWLIRSSPVATFVPAHREAQEDAAGQLLSTVALIVGLGVVLDFRDRVFSLKTAGRFPGLHQPHVAPTGESLSCPGRERAESRSRMFVLRHGVPWAMVPWYAARTTLLSKSNPPDYLGDLQLIQVSPRVALGARPARSAQYFSWRVNGTFPTLLYFACPGRGARCCPRWFLYRSIGGLTNWPAFRGPTSTFISSHR